MRAIERAITSLFRGDATLAGLCPGGIHRDIAKPGTTGVHLIWQWFGPALNRGTGGGQAADNGYINAALQLKAVAEGYDQEAAADAFERAENLLLAKVGAGLAPVGWTVMGVHRESWNSGSSPVGDRVYQGVGGVYRVLFQRG